MSIVEETVTPQDAANLLGINIRTMREWIKSDQIHAIQQSGNRWRIPRSAITAITDNSTPLNKTVSRLSIKRYVNGFEVPDNFDLIREYEELSEYTKAFAKRDINFLLLVGSPGSGKSRQLKSDLAGKRHAWIDNHATNLGLYCSVYEANNSPVVLDDINHFFKSKMACSLMKALTQTEGTRFVSWESTARALEERSVPRRFETSSPMCLIANQWSGSDADMAAIQDRSLPVAFFPSAETIHKRVVDLGWCDNDITEFIGQHLADISQPSMREYFQAMTYKNAGMNWQEKLLKLWTRR